MNILILNLLKYFPSNSPLTQKEKKKNNLVSRANIYTHTHTHTHTEIEFIKYITYVTKKGEKYESESCIPLTYQEI